MFKNKLKVFRFKIGGRVPWSHGYIEARDELILKALLNPIWSSMSLSPNYGYGFDERVVEIPWLYHRLSAKPACLWDVGSVLNREFILQQQKLQKKQIFISNLNPESKNHNRLKISYLYEDVTQTVVQDDFFHELLCVSTLEHIGFNNKKYDGARFSRKDPKKHLEAIIIFRQKLKRGGKAFITVPFGKRVDHGWFQVFDEGMVNQIIRTFAPTKSRVEIFQCSRSGWARSDAREASRSVFYDWSKNGNLRCHIAGSQAVACIELEK